MQNAHEVFGPGKPMCAGGPLEPPAVLSARIIPTPEPSVPLFSVSVGCRTWKNGQSNIIGEYFFPLKYCMYTSILSKFLEFDSGFERISASDCPQSFNRVKTISRKCNSNHFDCEDMMEMTNTILYHGYENRGRNDDEDSSDA